MQTEVFQGILIPFLGTTLGSACVLFMKNRLNQMVQRALTGFASRRNMHRFRWQSWGS